MWMTSQFQTRQSLIKMKTEHLLVVIALSITVTLYFFNIQNPSLKNYPPRNNTIVAFGDSLIEGYGSTEGNDFVSLLSTKLKRPIKNLGISGNTSRDGIDRVNQVVFSSPGTVILLFGGNDYLLSISKEETFNNLRQIINKLQSNGAFVVLVGVQGGIFNDGFKEYFEKLAKETGVLYVPNVLLGLFGDPDYMFDVVHPNDAGYEKIADKVYGYIKSYVW